MKRIISALLMLVSLNSYVACATPSYTVNDIFSYKRIGQVIVSPDGKQVAFTVMQAKLENKEKKWQTTLYLKNAQGNIKPLTLASQTPNVPTWSPNGKQIAFLAKGKKFDSIWMVDLTVNKVSKLLEFDKDIESFKWSPDGKYIAFAAADIKKEPRPVLIDPEKNNINIRIYLYSLDNKTNKIIPVTPSTYTISQGFSDLFSDSGFDWSPDSQSIAFAYQAHPGFNEAEESKIAILNLKTNNIVTIPYTNHFTGHQPHYSHDGKWIAFSSNSRDVKELTNNSYIYSHVCVTQTTDLNKTNCLADTFNQSPTLIGWNKTNDKVIVMDLYKVAGDKIYALSLDPHVPATLLSTTEGYIDPYSVSLNQTGDFLGLRYETTHQPPEAYSSALDPFELHKVSNINAGFHPILGNVESITWKSPDGRMIEGLVTTPPDYDAQKKYPLFVAVHGGPAGFWAKRFVGGCDERGTAMVPVCFEHLLSQGFVVFQPSPRGGSGYGKEFRTADYADFGGGDYNDIMSGIDYLIQRGVADPDHLAIFGWSYGGYLSTWAITQTNRFKVAIEGDGLTNLISHAGSGDIDDFLPQYEGVNFWDDATLYLQQSPIMHVKNINTPLLILQGMDDIRVPASQSYEIYTALKMQHKPVKLLLEPHTGHIPSDVSIISADVDAMDEWLQKAL